MLVPVTRRLDDQTLRARLVQDTGARFRTIAWVALAALIATGVVGVWTHPALLSSPRLQWKMGLVAVALILSALHDFVYGPRAGAAGAPAAERVRASWTARINLLVALAIVLLGISLLR